MSELNEPALPADPFVLLQCWVQDARAAQIAAPDAMSLATVGVNYRPSVRFVLLKGIDRGALTFFTNYRSRKASEIEAGRFAACALYWPQLRRQVRAEGEVTKLPSSESDAYFATRERGSQMAAWASPQDAVIENRAVIEHRVAELNAEYAGREVPRPPFWGGYRLSPDRLEFWTGRENRLHDRFLYRKLEAGDWSIDRLAP